MTIEEAVKAARQNTPVVYEDSMLGEMLFERIGSIRKDFALLRDVERGKARESYTLELLPMNRARSVTVADPERVRLAEAEDLRRLAHYEKDPSRPPVHPELICEEVKRANL